MARFDLTVDDAKGVLAVISRAETVHEAIEIANLIARTAQGIRLIHRSAKELPLTEKVGGAIPLPPGVQSAYVCACSRQFYDRWDAIGHVERCHASPEIRRDLDSLEDTIEALIVPSPLTDWDALATCTITQEEFDAVTAKQAK